MSKLFLFQEVSPNLFVITFETEVDMEKFYSGKPWLFDRDNF